MNKRSLSFDFLLCPEGIRHCCDDLLYPPESFTAHGNTILPEVASGKPHETPPIPGNQEAALAATVLSHPHRNFEEKRAKL